MSEDELFHDDDEDEIRNKLAAIGAEFDQFRAAVGEIAVTVIDYKLKLRSSRAFSKDEQFMLVMEYQTAILHAILHGNFGDNAE